MNTGYSFLRWSDPAQELGDTLRRQIEFAADWCNRNGVRLDTELNLRHAGSAYTGEHRRNPDRNALALFLKMADEGKIEKGSFLIVENLDRLSREEEVPACHLLTGILLAGIRVVQIKPELILTEKSDGWTIMRAVMELSRGHGESLMKSIRVCAVWAEKKRKARENGEPMTSSHAPWLKIVNGKFGVIKKRAAIVRRVFRLALMGYGVSAIARTMAEEGWEPLGRSGKWSRSFVFSLLRDRRVLGEHQPLSRSKKARKIEGDPILGYYPEIIDPLTFERAALSLEQRQLRGGRPNQQFANVFSGLLRDAVNGGSYYASMRRNQSFGNRILINHEAIAGHCKASSFPLSVFEWAVLTNLREIPTSEILNCAEDKTNEIQSLVEEKEKIERTLLRLQDALEGEGEIKTVLQKIKKLEAQSDGVREKLKELRRLDEARASEDWSEGKTLMDAVCSSGENAKRIQLRSLLNRSLEGIWLVVTGLQGKAIRVCVAQARFADSDSTRTYVIWHKPARVSRGKRFEAAFIVETELTYFKHLDLRIKENAYALRDFLRLLPAPTNWQPWPPATRRTRGQRPG